MIRREIWRNFDFWLFGGVFILSIFGIAMIRSAIAGNVTLEGLDQRQAIYVAVGIVVMLVTAWIDYHNWASLARAMYIGSVIFLVVVFIVGEAAFGSARWIETKWFFIQPSELVKIIMILVLADFFARTKDEVKDFRWIIRSLGLTLGVVIWILIQPNLSTSIVMLVLWFSLIWISGIPMKYLAIFAAVGLLVVIIFTLLIVSGVKIPFVEDYQITRVVDFLFPDPNARHGNQYNVEQALITIGSGGWFGQGYGHSSQVQLRFLQVRHTDYIFSAMASEFGLVGTTLVIGLLCFVILRCFRVAKNASDTFGSLIAYGVGILMFFQTSVNIGVNLNVVPVTGLTLPFISYGGSSLLSLVVGIGLVESVAAHQKKVET
jgi:rod shape determining protein RodA